MKLTRTDKKPTLATLVIEADGSDLEPIKRHVLAHFRHTAKVPGFRAGTAPMALVEKHVDQKVLLDEFVEHAVNQLYNQAVRHEKLRTVGQPQVQIKKFVPFTVLGLEIETEIIGNINLADYKKLKVNKPEIAISAADVNEVIKSLQKNLAARNEVDRAAKNGDELVIDFKGKDKAGKPVAGADANDYSLLLGSGSFIPGFEDNLIGTKAGDNKKFNVKFPADYGAATLQNKNVTFEVDIKKVNELNIPKPGDDFAKTAGPFKTMAELKADIKKQLKTERKNQAERDYENLLIADLVNKSSADIPDGLVEMEVQRLEEDEKRNLSYQGQTWQEHLKDEGVTEEQHRERNRPRARDAIKAGVMLSEIAELEKISVTPEEVEIRIQLLKGQYQDGAMQAELDKPQAKRDIEGRLMTEKTIAKLIEYSSR